MKIKFFIGLGHILFMIGILSVIRVIFVQYNQQHFAQLTFLDIATGFAGALRYDIAITFILFGVWLLGLFLPRLILTHPIFLVGYSAVGLIILIGVIVISIIDLAYFPNVGRHLTYELTILSNDMPSIVKIVYRGYLPLAIYSLAAISLIIILWYKLWRNIIFPQLLKAPPVKLKFGIVSLVIYLALAVSAARGGWQAKPINPGDALTNPKLAIGHITLNAPFTVIKHLKTDTAVEEISWIDKKTALHNVQKLLATSETQKYLSSEYPWQRQRIAKGNPKQMNVLLLVVESFSDYLLYETIAPKQPLLPFINDLSSRALYFENFVAAGTRSVEGLSSILGCLPSYPGESFIYSDFRQNNIYQAPLDFKRRGYETIFLHGSFYGSFNLHQFAKSLGFNKVLSKEDFSSFRQKSDDTWGIYDKYGLEFLAKNLGNDGKNFFAVFFTLSTHEPFVLLDKKYQLFDDRSLQNQYRESFYQFDDQLRDFFTAIEGAPWFKNTLFVITADHAWGASDLKERSFIPLIIYYPGVKPKKIKTLGSQNDILPTIFDILNWSLTHACAGRSLLATPEVSFALFSSENQYWFFDTLIYRFDQTQLLSKNPLNHNQLPLSDHNTKTIAARDFYLSWMQVNNNLLLHNKIYPLTTK